MSLTIQSTIALNNGVKIPVFGLGVFRSSRGSETFDAVTEALRVGYRHIDTAAVYGNEADVGRAVRESGIPREEIFVTSKLWNEDQGYDKALLAFDASLKRLGLEYLDLYLIHWPVQNLRKGSWRALEKIYADKRTRAIGVSNFVVRHLEELMRDATVVPAVNQVELSPFLYLKDLITFCTKNKIAVESYSPLTKGQRFTNPVLMNVAARYKKTPAQILVRWAIEHSIIVIPKSVKPERILENSQVFDFALTKEDLELLDSLNENFRTAWDPTNAS